MYAYQRVLVPKHYCSRNRVLPPALLFFLLHEQPEMFRDTLAEALRVREAGRPDRHRRLPPPASAQSLIGDGRDISNA